MIKRLPHDEFLKTFEKVPRVAFNLLIEDPEGRVLLTKRSIPPEQDLWHFPGSFLLKEETINECLQRIARDEFGYDLQEKPQLAGVFEDLDKDPRGHVIDIIYKVTLDKQVPLVATSETKEAKYFDTLPENIGFNHKESLVCLGYK
jgi:ADP-ribose pyrophosphatase YjhB (NUDIX family)